MFYSVFCLFCSTVSTVCNFAHLQRNAHSLVFIQDTWLHLYIIQPLTSSLTVAPISLQELADIYAEIDAMIVIHYIKATIASASLINSKTRVKK